MGREFYVVRQLLEQGSWSSHYEQAGLLVHEYYDMHALTLALSWVPSNERHGFPTLKRLALNSGAYVDERLQLDAAEVATLHNEWTSLLQLVFGEPAWREADAHDERLVKAMEIRERLTEAAAQGNCLLVEL